MTFLSFCVSQICFLVSAFRGRMFSEDSCATLGLFFHYFHLSQFSWMLILVFLFPSAFYMGHTFSKCIHFGVSSTTHNLLCYKLVTVDKID